VATKNNEEIYIGLDVGSTKIRCVVGLLEEGAPLPSIIGVGESPANGIRKGVVVDVDEAVSSVTAAVEEAERISGVAIDRATISIDGAHVQSQNSTGVVAVGRADQEVTVDDLNRVEEAAVAVQLPPNREIIQVFPRHYTVDSQTGIKDPVGMHGVRLEVESHIVTGATPAIKNLDKAIYQAGIMIQGQVLVALAASRAVLSKRQKELGTALVDIGGGTTGIAVYEEGDILYSSVIPVGSGHITNDIAIGLKTDIDTAERLKLKYARAGAGRLSGDRAVIEELGATSTLNLNDLQDIVAARLEELINLIRLELKKVGKDKLLPGGVVLTGGGSKMVGIEEMARQMLELPVIISAPEDFTGLGNKVKDPSYAAAVGLMLENMNHSSMGSSAANNIGQTVTKLRGMFKKFLP
jgi:cell division protein FtsA